MQRMSWVLAGFLTISIIVSANLWSELHHEQELSASLREELSSSADRLRAATSAPQVDTPMTQAPAATENKPATPAPAGPQTPAAVRKVVVTEQELLKDSEFRKARLAQIRSLLGHSYPGLSEELGLSKEEADRLFNLLAENQLNASALSASLAAGEQPDPTTLAELTRQRQESQLALNDSLQAMLGSRFTQWQAYQPTRAARMQATTFGTQLAQAGMPLNNSQLKSLTSALISQQQMPQPNTGALAAGLSPQDPDSRAQFEEAITKRQEQNNRRTLEAATPYLNTQQLAILKAQFDQQAALTRAAAKARERAQAAR